MQVSLAHCRVVRLRCLGALSTWVKYVIAGRLVSLYLLGQWQRVEWSAGVKSGVRQNRCVIAPIFGEAEPIAQPI